MGEYYKPEINLTREQWRRREEFKIKCYNELNDVVQAQYKENPRLVANSPRVAPYAFAVRKCFLNLHCAEKLQELTSCIESQNIPINPDILPYAKTHEELAIAGEFDKKHGIPKACEGFLSSLRKCSLNNVPVTKSQE